MTQLYNIGLRQRQKIKVISMFGMGILYQPHCRQSCPAGDAIKNPSYSEGNRYVYFSSYGTKHVLTDKSANAIVVLGNVELYVDVMVACGPPTNQLVQYILPRMRHANEASSEASNGPMFVDRSLVPIDKRDVAPTSGTDGGLTATTMSSTTRDIV
ncbi:hypothetical protein FCULG_00011260 [Fusarium culmorum]|uniref:Uncharacterized protein n=1 Tax=Fusarium culmorum TaxID=5516 RepID=A0A2T4H548_FUSCU|nr:hypothetical protein FCULG_00011260 [Fusarium culmorum]